MDKPESTKAAILIAAFAFAYSSFLFTLEALGINILEIVFSAGGVSLMTGFLTYYYLEFKRRKTKDTK